MEDIKKRLWKVECAGKVLFIFTEYKDIARREAIKIVHGYDIPKGLLWTDVKQQFAYENTTAVEIEYHEI